MCGYFYSARRMQATVLTRRYIRSLLYLLRVHTKSQTALHIKSFNNHTPTRIPLSLLILRIVNNRSCISLFTASLREHNINSKTQSIQADIGDSGRNNLLPK